MESQKPEEGILNHLISKTCSGTGRSINALELHCAWADQFCRVQLTLYAKELLCLEIFGSKS